MPTIDNRMKTTPSDHAVIFIQRLTARMLLADRFMSCFSNVPATT